MLARVRKLLSVHDRNRVAAAEIADVDARMRSVVDHVVDGVISINTSGIVETFNPAAERIFGYDASEIIGKNVQVLMPEPDQARHDSYLWNYLETGDAKIIGGGREVAGLRKDGTTFPMELAISEFHSGGERFFTGIIRDITERKRLEQELHQRLKQLGEADRRKDHFISMLGHELRNPLAPFSNGIQVLKRMELAQEPNAAQVIRMMERQVGQMVRLVDDLLDVSRITSGKIELRREPVDIAAAVQHALEGLRPQIDAKHQQVLLSVPADPIYVRADAARVEQIIANLVTNAIKYSDAETNINISLAATGNRARLIVRDDGIGIPADKLHDIFDMFVQVEPSFARRQGGLGLGLALVRSLVELHGGSVVAHSAGPGKGSEFVVELPLHRERRGARKIAKEGPATASRQRILVIDDNQDSADSLAVLLKEIGHDVTTLYSGRTAVDEVARRSPDVVLCDLTMPDMSGLDVARELRSVFKERNLKLIATTGAARAEDAALAKAAGFNHHLTKPINLEQLAAAMAMRER